jgi:hypothetical protein
MAPLLASLALVATVSNALPWTSLAVWGAVNLVAALLTAGLTTVAVEGRTRRQFQ